MFITHIHLLITCYSNVFLITKCHFLLMKLLQRFSSYFTLFHYVLVPSHCIISLPFVIIVIWLPNSGSQSLTGHYTHMSMNMEAFPEDCLKNIKERLLSLLALGHRMQVF